MNKLIRKGKIAGILMLLIQLLTLAALIVLSFLYPDFDYYTLVVAITAAFFFLMQIIFFWIYNKRISHLKRRTEMKAADIIGNDIQEAYYFGKIGLAVTDENGTILWVNEFLEDRNLDFIDKKIGEFLPELQMSVVGSSGDVSIKTTYQNHIYEVKFIKEANLYIFKDVTEYETLFKYSNDQAPVVGYLTIDNYSDILASYDESKVNDMTSNIRKMILEYFGDHQVMTRSLKDDSYLLVCTKKNFDEIYKDRFSLIDEVRKAFVDGYTLSIGIAYGFPDYSKLKEIASNALDVALSRGGDQVVIAPFSENMEFIGGKSEARVSRNKVKIRTISQSLVTLISHSSNVLIMGHTNADFDAIGACLGVKAICDHIHRDARIIFEEQFIEKKVRRAVRSIFSPREMQQIFVNFKGANEFYNNDTLIIVVDCNNPELMLYPMIIDENTNVAIIDHHRRSDRFLSNVIFNSIDPSASSASELVAEYISYNQAKMDLPPSYATMMLCGILLDTNFYRLKTSLSTYEASAILKQFGADNEKADEFLKEDYEEYALKTKIMSNFKTPFYGVLVANSDQDDIVDISMLAIVAREALMIRGVNACFVIGRTSENEIRISSRSDGTINCQMLMEKLGGGGHFTAAACQFDSSNIEEIGNKLQHILDEYLQLARSRDDEDK